MYQKNHVGSLKETVVLQFTNGYQITLEAGIEMSMSLTMIEKSAQQSFAPDSLRAVVYRLPESVQVENTLPAEGG